MYNVAMSNIKGVNVVRGDITGSFSPKPVDEKAPPRQAPVPPKAPDISKGFSIKPNDDK